MKRPSADCSHFESEANRFHGEHSASDVVTLISDGCSQSVSRCWGVGRQRRVFLVDVNDWDFAPRDSLRGLGSASAFVRCQLCVRTYLSTLFSELFDVLHRFQSSIHLLFSALHVPPSFSILRLFHRIPSMKEGQIRKSARCEGHVRKSARKKQSQSVSIHVNKKLPSERIPSVTSATRSQMQVGFLSNCTHTLIVQRSACVKMKCRNTSSLATTCPAASVASSASVACK